jgi:hypothetical protein
VEELLTSCHSVLLFCVQGRGGFDPNSLIIVNQSGGGQKFVNSVTVNFPSQRNP